MNFKLLLNPLPFPDVFNHLSNLKLVLGLCLFLGGLLVFSMWRDRYMSVKEDERSKFLMFNMVGGSWIIAIFAVSGGLFFVFDSVFRFK